MNISPTSEPGIRIDIESLLDWSRLQLIVVEAAKQENSLALVLGRNMDMEDDWVDYVLPDIQDGFNEQVKFVDNTLKKARSKNVESGEIFITPENVHYWYGALNQARLTLEANFNVSNYSELEDLDSLEESVKSSVIKNHFFCALQSQLLTHVMTPRT